MSHIHNSDGPKGPASMLTRFSHCVASAAGRVLMIGLTLATASHMDAVQAQTDRSSHRLLNSSGHGLADLQSQAQLLTRLRMLTEAGGSASGTNPGIADPRVQQALQQMLTQQLRESLPPSTEPGTGPVRPGDPDAFGGIDPSDPDFQAMIERLSRSTGQPFDDMVRQWMESNQAGTAPPSPQPGRPPSGPGQEPREIPNPTPGGTPTTQPGSSSGRTMTTGPEAIDPETQKQRIAELVRMIEGLGRFTGPAGSNPGGSPGRTPNRGPEPRSTPGTQPGSQNPEREPWFWEPSDDQQQQATGRPQPADTGLRQDAPEPEEPEVDVWQKLGRIAQRAQSRSTNIEEETSGATDQSNAGVRSALARAIEETARDLAGRTDEFLQNRERERFQSRHDTSSSDSDFFGGIGRMTDSANDWVVDISDAGNSGGHRLASAADSDSGSSFPLIALVLMSLILTTGICLYRNREALNRQAVRARLPEIPRHLRDRGDVVQAFHALAARCPEALHEWWTHRRAAIVLARVSPEKSEAVQTLARLYEEARYTPQDREFTEQQLDSARRALRRFGES